MSPTAVLSLAFWVVAYAIAFLFGPTWLRRFLLVAAAVIIATVIIGVGIAALV